jgi:hypothetical protein
MCLNYKQLVVLKFYLTSDKYVSYIFDYSSVSLIVPSLHYFLWSIKGLLKSVLPLTHAPPYILWIECFEMLNHKYILSFTVHLYSNKWKLN